MSRFRLPALWHALLLAALAAATWLSVFPDRAQASASHDLLFVENVGQFPRDVRFQVLGLEETLWITQEGFVRGHESVVWRPMNGEGLLPQEPAHSYFLGPDPDSWYLRVPVWGAVRLIGALPGTDLLLTGADGRLSAAWKRAGQPARAAAGDPLISWLATAKRPVAGDDPALSFSTLLGADADDWASGIAVAPDGDILLAGTTFSTVFPSPDTNLLHGVDVIVARFTPDASALDFALHINPPDLNAEDRGMAITADAAGNAYVAGWVSSPGFPTTPGAYDRGYNGEGDAFALKIDPGGDLLYSTFLGGTELDVANALAVDATGAAVVVGSTWSTDFVTTTVGPAGTRDIFAVRLAPDGSDLVAGLRLGGSGQDEATTVAWTGDGWLVGGWTNSADWPTTGGSLQPAYGGDTDGFLLRLSASALAPTMSTYLGGTREDRVWGVAADGTGRALATGATASDDFPTSADAFDRSRDAGTCPLCTDAFAVRLTPADDGLSFGSYFGGSGDDTGQAIAISSLGEATITGLTESADFPLAGTPFDADLGGDRDGFLLRFNSAGTGLTYGSLLGGSARDEGLALALVDGMAIVAGRTESADFPLTASAYDVTHNGQWDAFVLALALVGDGPNPDAGQVFLPAIVR